MTKLTKPQLDEWALIKVRLLVAHLIVLIDQGKVIPGKKP